MSVESLDECFELIGLLKRTPSVNYGNSCAMISADGDWSISFSIDVDHPIGWKVVRKLADTLNDPSRNGGAAMFIPMPKGEFCPDGRMRWSIQGSLARLGPKECASLLYSRMPHPIDDLDAWERHDC